MMKMKIRHKLILGFLVIALLISCVGYLTIKRSQDALQKSIEESSMILASKVMDEVDRNIFRRVEGLQAYSQDLLFKEDVIRSNSEYERMADVRGYIAMKNREWLSVSTDMIIPFMQQLMNKKSVVELLEKTEFYHEKYGYEVFKSIIVTNKYGAIVCMTGRAADFSQSEKQWWKEAKEHRFYIRDAAFEEDAGTYSLVFAIRIEDDKGNFIGVMKCLLNIEDIIQAVKEFETPETHTGKKTVYKLLNRKGQLLYSTDAFAFLSTPVSESLMHNETEKKKSHIVLRKDEKYGEVLSVCVHSNYEALGMVFVVEHAVKNIFAPVFSLKKELFLISVGITILAVVLGVALSTSIAGPLTQLRDAAARIGEGDLNTGIAMRATDEVGDLALSFRKMTEDLKKTTVSKAYLDNIITTMVDTLLVTDMEGRIKTINEAAKRLLGYEESELVNQPLKIIFSDADNEKTFSGMLLKGMDSGHMTQGDCLANEEKTLVSKDGRKIPVLFSASVMRSRKGRPEGLVCIALDITERKLAEEKLMRYAEEVREANEELKAFAYIISHDLRAPLVNIKGFAGELRYALKEILSSFQHFGPHMETDQQKKLDIIFQKDAPEALGFIDSSVYRMDNLIKAILNLSRVGRRDLRPEVCDMRSLVRSILKTLTHQTEQKNVAITVGDLPEIVADKIAMEQIVGNILDNALKYLEPGRPGAVEIFAERGRQDAVFHIRDNGRGIAQDDIGRVFEVFQRVGRQDVPGEGMGLAYGKTLVRRHGGRIWCTSELGVGTTFSFLIPSAPRQPAVKDIAVQDDTVSEDKRSM